MTGTPGYAMGVQPLPLAIQSILNCLHESSRGLGCFLAIYISIGPLESGSLL